MVTHGTGIAPQPLLKLVLSLGSYFVPLLCSQARCVAFSPNARADVGLAPAKKHLTVRINHAETRLLGRHHSLHIQVPRRGVCRNLLKRRARCVDVSRADGRRRWRTRVSGAANNEQVTHGQDWPHRNHLLRPRHRNLHCCSRPKVVRAGGTPSQMSGLGCDSHIRSKTSWSQVALGLVDARPSYVLFK